MKTIQTHAMAKTPARPKGPESQSGEKGGKNIDQHTVVENVLSSDAREPRERINDNKDWYNVKVRI